VRFKRKHGDRSLPSRVWERVYEEIGPPPFGVPLMLVGGMEGRGTYILEDVKLRYDLEKLPPEILASFPADLQEIILEVKSGVPCKSTFQMSFGDKDANGNMKIHHRIQFETPEDK